MSNEKRPGDFDANSGRQQLTDRAFIDLWNQHGTPTKMAAATGMNTRKIFERRRAIEHRHGIKLTINEPVQIPDHFPPPAGFSAHGVSTLYDADGQVRAQWVKANADTSREALQEAVAALCDKIPRAKPSSAPKGASAHLLNLITLTDCHLGMYAWEPEAGADWDLSIAEDTIAGCFERLLAACPVARVGYLNQGGDFLHTDGLKALTPASGHLLDADSRYQKIVRVAVRVLRRIVDAMLRRHELVVINMLDANHDPVGETWLRELFAALYEREPRVQVNMSPSPYVAYQHGQTMLAFHHGHGAKKPALPLLFASRFSEMWGATSHRYCHVGHLHHIDEKEHPGMIVTQHPTLAAQDAYASRGGWDAKRAAQAITYHEKHGEVGRATIRPEMLA